MKHHFLRFLIAFVLAASSGLGLAADPDATPIRGELDLLLLYYAKNGEKVPYEGLTFNVFPQYQKELDVFKRQELVEKSKPAIDKKLADLKAVTDFYIEVMSTGQPMSPYDFNKKGFNVFPPADPNCLSFFGVGFPRAICYKFKNQQKFSFMGVADIEKAKQLEKMRTTYGSFGNSRIYFRVVGFDESIKPMGKQPIAEVTKIVVSDKAGNQLYTLQ